MNTPLVNYCIPSDMEQYMSFYGLHFNKKLCDFAVGMMEKEDKATGEMKRITPMTYAELKPILEASHVKLQPNDTYDAVYLTNMVKADYWGSSIEDEEHMARYIEDVICDPDGYDGIVFCRFVSDCNAKGIAIFWDMML